VDDLGSAVLVHDPRCAVCGTAVGELPARACARCDTRVHAECWEYGGGCPRFACPESRCLREMALRCPVCARSTYSTWSKRTPVMLHWQVNPGLALNELVFGQRIPATLFLCQACDAPLADRTWVVCVQCQRVISGSQWSAGTAFGNWLGLVCPHCGGEVPSLRNWTAALITWVSAPVWWLVHAPLKRRYLAWAHARARARATRLADRRFAGRRVAITKERLLALEDEPSLADDNRGSLSPRFVASARCSDEDRSG
jgi:hypothetical protein